MKTLNKKLDENQSNESEKKSLKKKIFTKENGKKYLLGLRTLAIYFFIFFVTITLSELFIRFQMSGKISKMNLTFLAFVPAEAMFFAAFAGFFKNLGNKITLPILLFIINIYYCIQLVYFRIFGSLFSVSMLGMGNTAVGNFSWAMKGVIISSIFLIFLFLLPLIASIVLVVVTSIKKCKLKGYPLLLHIPAFLLSVVLFVSGIFSIKMLGTDIHSAYYVLTNNSSDTDTTALRLGAMTTFIVESGAYYFGIGNNSDSFEAVTIEKNDIILEDKTETANKDEDNKDEDNNSEEVTYVYEPHIDPAFDFDALAEETPNGNLKNTYIYFAQKEPTYTNEYTGYFEGYNLIYICAEGFWKYAINEKVTPVLYEMSNNGIILTNYYNSFLNTTTNGEFAFATSLWPDVSRSAMSGTDVGSFPQSARNFMPYGIADFFNDNGIETYGFHNYYGSYYRRNISWPNIGIKNIKFMEDMKFSSHWPSSDLEMMEQSMDDYVNNGQFFTYYMTFSGHGPYNSSNYMANKNIDEVKERLGSDADKYNDEALRYFACNLEFEKGMEYLYDKLMDADILDKTVIVITGDHYPYYLDDEGRESLCQKEISEIEQYHSCCIIYNSAIEEPIINDTFCCNVDIEPTILNLFNLPYDSRLLFGKDIFSDSQHNAILYNKSFINDKVVYDSKTHEAIWKIDTSKYSQETLDKYLESYIKQIDMDYKASVNIMQNNFFLTLWKQAGLLSNEDIAKENARSAEAMAINEKQNEIDAQKEQERLEREAAEAAAAAQAEQDANNN